MNGASETVSLGLAHEVEVQLRKAGATRENFWAPVSRSEVLAQKIVDLVTTRPTFEVVIDYTQLLADVIKTGHYDRVNEEITQEHFPIQGDGRQEVTVALFHFNRRISSDDAIAGMKQQGFCPGKIEHLLALGAAHPDLQKQFSIVALGSSWQHPNGNCSVPSLFWFGNERFLNLDWLEGVWHLGCRFLAVSA